MTTGIMYENTVMMYKDNDGEALDLVSIKSQSLNTHIVKLSRKHMH